MLWRKRAKDVAKVGVGGSKPLARSIMQSESRGKPRLFVFGKPRYD